MIAYIKGKTGYVDTESSAAVIETGGVGYRIFMTSADLELLPAEGGEVKVYTYLQIREDAFVLYGFLTREDRRLFEQLIGVSGIGPKAALGILGTLEADDFKFAVLSDDAKTIARAPGVGLKTAKKIILDLKDRIDPEEVLDTAVRKKEEGGGKPHTSDGRRLDRARSEAAEALTALGYSSTEALKAVRQVEASEDAEVEDILKGALKYIG